MSARIEATLAVLQRIQDRYRSGMLPLEIRQLRVEAVNEVAASREVTAPTVSNKYRREMHPHFDGTHDFDEAVQSWLRDGSDELKRVLREHAITHADLNRISAFFFDDVSCELQEQAGRGDEGRPTDFARALQYAAQLHAGQIRKDPEGTPYIGHLLGVCSLVLEAQGDEEQAIAALLHDAAEDQGGRARLAEIRERFGDRVADLVAACTDTFETPKPAWRARKTQYLASLDKQSGDALLVVCADKLYNARAILRDYRFHGESIFDRFKGGKDRTLWYYRAVADRLRASELESWLVSELSWTVAALEYWAGEG